MAFQGQQPDVSRPVLNFALVSALAGGLTVLYSAVAMGDPAAIDQGLLLALRVPGALDNPIGSKAVEGFMRDVTGLGGLGVLALLVGFLAVFFRLQYWRGYASGLLVVTISGWLASHAFKYLVGRPRPELVPHETEFWNASMPSGHAMSSAVVYLTLAMLIASTEASLTVRRFVISAAIVLVLLIGASRVYLGVHWPTDVLFGWALGGLWAWAGWRLIERRTRVTSQSG